MGVRSIHGVPGDYNLVALDYIEKAGLKWVGNVNELNAGKLSPSLTRGKSTWPGILFSLVILRQLDPTTLGSCPVIEPLHALTFSLLYLFERPAAISELLAFQVLTLHGQVTLPMDMRE
jgi:hypothetical protein